MRNISSAFARALMNDKRDYENRIAITLADNTQINVDNSRIWDNGFRLQDAVSGDDDFQIGAAIINQITIVLNNIYGDFDLYSFDGAKVIVFTGLTDLDDGTSEELRMGTFIVDETKYNGSLITLTCIDNMSKFDKAYDTTLLYPATLSQIVMDACSKCGVQLDPGSTNFPHNNYIVSTKPSSENTTYRQVISWAAQIAGCYARCNVYGYLAFGWYKTDEFDNISSWIDGGIFDGINVDWLMPYISTDTGMTTISSSTSDDTWFRVQNSIGIEFNENTFDYLYIDSDSCYAFTNTQPTSHGHNSLKDINVCTRDGQSTLIKYQIISADDKSAIKVRFHGYTRYGSNYQLPEYELEYEIFFTNDKEIIINFITLPTNTSYLGTSSIVENTISTAFTPVVNTTIGFEKDEDNKWNKASVSGAYVTGDDADGGSFNPWDTGDVYDGGTFSDRGYIHFITQSYSSNISTDDVVITGVKVVKKIKAEGQSESFIEYMSGTNGYVISIEGNDFIDGTHGQDVADWLGTLINGLKFRKADLVHPNDPSIEAGDVGVFIDTKDRIYPVLISSTTFCPGDSQETLSSAKTPAKNSAQRFSEATRDYVDIRKQIKQQKDSLEEEIARRIANASGLYYTEVEQPGGGSKIYYHNKAELEESDIVMLFSSTGFTLTANYQDPNPTWYGMTVDGIMIASILSVSGINADWINTGHLSFSYCQGGTLRLGGSNNGNGLLEIYNSSNVRNGLWNNERLVLGTNEDVVLKNTGEIIAKTPIRAAGGLWAVNTDYTVGTQDNLYCDYRYDHIAFYDFRDTTATYNDRGQLWIRSIPRTYHGGLVNCLDIYASKGNLSLRINSGIDCQATIVVAQGYTKPKAIETQNYGEHLLYCYETPTPYFGDMGLGQLDSAGECIVSIDDMLREGIAKTEYLVFLQKEGQGDLWIEEKDETYFVVKGTPGLRFSWELKAPQRYFENYRLDDRHMEPTVRVEDNPDCGLPDLEEYLKELDNSDDDLLSLTQTLNQLDEEYVF